MAARFTSHAGAGRNLTGWTPPDRGVLFVVSGPSGVGKSTLLRGAVTRIPGLAFSVSATTRAPRPGEQDGVDYHFIERERFDSLVAENAFIEHATVYDRSYGTLRAPTEAALVDGMSLILDIDVQGSASVRQSLPESVHIFVLPPSLRALEARLRARGTDSEEVVQLRMDQVEQQLTGCGAFDYLVVNDDLTTARAVFEGILLAEMSRRSRRSSWVDAIKSELSSRKER